MIAEQFAASSTGFVANPRPFFQDPSPRKIADFVDIQGDFIVGFHLLQDYRS